MPERVRRLTGALPRTARAAAAQRSRSGATPVESSDTHGRAGDRGGLFARFIISAVVLTALQDRLSGSHVGAKIALCVTPLLSCWLLATGLSGQEMMPGTARPLDREPAGNHQRIHLPDASERSEGDAGHLQHLRHDARAGRSDGDRGLLAARHHRTARGQGRTEDQVPHRHPPSADRRAGHAVCRSPRQALSFLHRQPRHDAVLPRASGAREGRLVHDRARDPGAGPVHVVQRLHAGRRRTADDRAARSSPPASTATSPRRCRTSSRTRRS